MRYDARDRTQDTSDATIIYGAADVSRLLDVTRAAVSNYLARNDENSPTPAPAFVTTDGRSFWDADGMRAWIDWHASIRDRGTRRWRAETMKKADAAIDALRAEIGAGK